MQFIFFVLAITFSFSVSAEDRAEQVVSEKAQIIKLCANPKTGEQIEYVVETTSPCPDGFHTYYDLTSVPIESVANVPPPIKHGSEQDKHDD